MRDFNRRGGRSFGSFGGRSSARPEMHSAICDECGKSCQVPFKPTGNKEIFCSDCFERRGGNESSARRAPQRNFNRFEDNDSGYGRNDRNERRDSFGSRDREMFSAICDECGKDCKLPFKPSSNKPVYCSECFEKRGVETGLHSDRNFLSRGEDRAEGVSGASRKELGEMRDQINSINVKLEKIMRALNIETKVEKKAEKTVKDVEVVMNEIQDLLVDEDIKLDDAVEKVAKVKKVAKTTKTTKVAKAKKTKKAE